MGDNCQLLISGADEQEAHQRLSQWLRDEFPHCDAPLVEVKSDELEPLPISLTNLNPQIIRARTVCSGSAGGILTPMEAHQRLSQWLRDEFPHCDAPLVEVKSDELEPLPISLTNLNPQIIRARTVCSGSAGGILTPISSLDLNALGNLSAAKGVDAEQSALENGLTLVLKNIEFRLQANGCAMNSPTETHRWRN